MTTETADNTSVMLTFDDFYVLSAEDIDAFSINWNDHDEPPPYWITVDGRRFSFTGLTFLVRGFGAALPRWVKEQEAAGHLALFVERDSRLLAYVHDPAAEAAQAEE